MKAKKLNTTNAQGEAIVAQATDESKDNAFANVLRQFEADYASGDYTDSAYTLCGMLWHSVLKKVADPQRKDAGKRETVSNSGMNPAIVALKRETVADVKLLEDTARNADMATENRFNSNGDYVTEIANSLANEALNELIQERLGDGLDGIHTAVETLLELAQTHADSGAGWMEKPYTIRRVNRKVLIKDETASIVEEETTPIQEVYRSIRRYIDNSRAMQTDPRNGYSYLEEMATDADGEPLEAVYRRMNRFADLGGYDCNGLYTIDTQTVHDYNDIMEKLNLTDRQLQIVNLRMQGYGKTAIASKLGVTPRCIEITLARLQERCRTIGFEP